MEKKLSVLFDREGVSGKIELFNAGKADIEAFSLDGYRLDITVTDPSLEAGAYATALTVRCDTPFTFFLRDVNAEWPIYIPEYGVAVTEATDRRDYAEIQRAIRSKGLKRRLDNFEERQESFASAAEKNRSMRAPLRRQLVPHPEGKRATSCAGGRYNPETEQVIIDGFTQKAEIVLEY